MHRYSAALCASLAVALLCAVPVRAEAPPAWLYATLGTRALLGTDGEDASVAIVCNTAQAYRTMESGKTTPENSCGSRAEGTTIVIDSIVNEGTTCDQHRTLLGIHAVDGSWKGYAAITAVYPAIPTGTTLTLKPIALMPRASIANDRSIGPEGGTDIGTSATVKVTSFKPTSFNRDLLVMVESGSHAGLRGWTFSVQTLIAGKEADQILCPASKR
jgi:hypothetical protein